MYAAAAFLIAGLALILWLRFAVAGGLFSLLFVASAVVIACRFLYLAHLNKWQTSEELRRLYERSKPEPLRQLVIREGVPGWLARDGDFRPMGVNEAAKIARTGKANAAAPKGTTAHATPTKETTSEASRLGAPEN